jgi:hypothetical protein
MEQGLELQLLGFSEIFFEQYLGTWKQKNKLINKKAGKKYFLLAFF